MRLPAFEPSCRVKFTDARLIVFAMVFRSRIYEIADDVGPPELDYFLSVS